MSQASAAASSACSRASRIALDSIRANKVRAGLTILGIAVGVFVVVVISAAIHGINASVAKDFESAGPTTFFVSRFPISFEACDGTDDTCKWRPQSARSRSPTSRRSARCRPSAPPARSSTRSATIKYKDRALRGAQVDRLHRQLAADRRRRRHLSRPQLHVERGDDGRARRHHQRRAGEASCSASPIRSTR